MFCQIIILDLKFTPLIFLHIIQQSLRTLKQNTTKTKTHQKPTMSKVKFSYIPLRIFAKISCLDASQFKMLVESSPCRINEQKGTQMTKKKLSWMPFFSLGSRTFDSHKHLSAKPTQHYKEVHHYESQIVELLFSIVITNTKGRRHNPFYFYSF